MNFYKQQHKYYCGIDLHARKMYVCILDQKGKTIVHKNIKTDPELLFETVLQEDKAMQGCNLSACKSSKKRRESGSMVPADFFL